MGGQEHGTDRNAHLVRQPAQRRHEFIRKRCLVSADAWLWIERPPRERGEPTGEKHTAPELPVRVCGGWPPVAQADVAHLTAPVPGSLPTARVPEHTLPSSETSRGRARSRHPS